MDNVSFLQQQLTEIRLQIAQLDDKRRKLQTEYYKALLLQKHNLTTPEAKVE